MKVNEIAPVNPDNNIKKILISLLGFIIFEDKWVIVQNKNKIVNALATTLKKLIDNATSSGLLKANKEKLPNVKLKARLIIPDGYKNYGYLAYKNFDSLLNWNRSNYFAIAVGTLADFIKENN